MRITPYEILVSLGFNVPPEGVEVSLDETGLYIETLKAHKIKIDLSRVPDSEKGYLYNESIRLIEEVVDVTTIPDSLLSHLHGGFKKLILACRNEELYNSQVLDSDMVDWLSALVDSNHCTADCKIDQEEESVENYMP